MRDINEVLALQDINQKIYYLKKGRKTDLPDAVKLYNDWNPNRHEIITDEEKYPKIKVTLKPEKKYTDLLRARSTPSRSRKNWLTRTASPFR